MDIQEIAGGIKIFRAVSKSPFLSVIISENEWRF